MENKRIDRRKYARLMRDYELTLNHYSRCLDFYNYRYPKAPGETEVTEAEYLEAISKAIRKHRKAINALEVYELELGLGGMTYGFKRSFGEAPHSVLVELGLLDNKPWFSAAGVCG